MLDRQTSLKAALIIPTYRRYEVLATLLASINNLDTTCLSEIIIVDQSPREECPSWLPSWFEADARRRYLRLDEPSLPRARNVALRNLGAQTDIVIFIDDDTLLPPSFLQAHCDTYQDPTVQAVCGREFNTTKGSELKDVLNLLLRPIAMTLGKGNRYKRNLIAPGLVLGEVIFLGTFNSGQPSIADTVKGCNMSFRKSALLAIKGFDEHFTRNARREENDAAARCRTHFGKDCIHYNPAAYLIHSEHVLGGCKITANAEKFENVMSNERHYLEKHVSNQLARCAAEVYLTLKTWWRG